MNPKSGKAGSLVKPAAPREPFEADQADPGQVEQYKAEQVQSKSGKYGSTPVTIHKPPQTPEEKTQKNSWIEIELVDEEDNPVPGEAYRIGLPDGSVAEGTLDEKGFARIEGIEPGACSITFPNLDQDAWEKA